MSLKYEPASEPLHISVTVVTVWGRYLTPPDFSASGNRVVVSMEDVNLGKQREKNLSWIQKVIAERTTSHIITT